MKEKYIIILIISLLRHSIFTKSLGQSCGSALLWCWSGSAFSLWCKPQILLLIKVYLYSSILSTRPLCASTPPLCASTPPFVFIYASIVCCNASMFACTSQLCASTPPLCASTPTFSASTPPFSASTPPFSAYTPPFSAYTPPFSASTPPFVCVQARSSIFDLNADPGSESAIWLWYGSGFSLWRGLCGCGPTLLLLVSTKSFPGRNFFTNKEKKGYSIIFMSKMTSQKLGKKAWKLFSLNFFKRWELLPECRKDVKGRSNN